MNWTCVYYGTEPCNRKNTIAMNGQLRTQCTRLSRNGGCFLSDETQSLDRRIERTRLALRNALILMLAEHSWDEINIRDLCAQANVGRSTFYLHFQGKEELLVSAFDDLRGWLASQRSDEQPSNALPFVRGLIEHADEQRQLFRIIIGRRSG